MDDLEDAPRLIANYGPGEWVKMQHVLKGVFEGEKMVVVVHYFKNLSSGRSVEFKFK